MLVYHFPFLALCWLAYFSNTCFTPSFASRAASPGTAKLKFISLTLTCPLTTPIKSHPHKFNYCDLFLPLTFMKDELGLLQCWHQLSSMSLLHLVLHGLIKIILLLVHFLLEHGHSIRLHSLSQALMCCFLFLRLVMFHISYLILYRCKCGKRNLPA